MLGSSYQVGLVGGSGAEPPPPLGPAPTWEDGDPSPPPHTSEGPACRRCVVANDVSFKRAEVLVTQTQKLTELLAHLVIVNHAQPLPRHLLPPFAPAPPASPAGTGSLLPVLPNSVHMDFLFFFFDQCPCSFLYESPVPHHTITSGHVWFFFLE